MKKRYPDVVKRMLADLRTGKVGDLVPSEATLSEQFGASRSTIRSALAELQRLGLIERKQGAPTRVLSTEPPPSYVHTMSATGDLMQFAGPSRRVVQSIAPLVADEALAERLQDRPGRRWVLIRQTRHIDGQDAPVGWTDIYLCDSYSDIAQEIPNYSGLVYTLLEERHDVVIREIHQAVRAAPVPVDLARMLQVEAGGHALELRRCYRDADGENRIITVSTMPAEHYTYEITLRRKG